MHVARPAEHILTEEYIIFMLVIIFYSKFSMGLEVLIRLIKQCRQVMRKTGAIENSGIFFYRNYIGSQIYL